MRNSKRFAIAATVCALLGIAGMILSWFGLYPRADRYVFFYLWALFLCTAAIVQELQRILSMMVALANKDEIARLKRSVGSGR